MSADTPVFHGHHLYLQMMKWTEKQFTPFFKGKCYATSVKLDHVDVQVLSTKLAVTTNPSLIFLAIFKIIQQIKTDSQISYTLPCNTILLSNLEGKNFGENFKEVNFCLVN